MTKLYDICDAALMSTFKAFGDFKVLGKKKRSKRCTDHTCFKSSFYYRSTIVRKCGWERAKIFGQKGII